MNNSVNLRIKLDLSGIKKSDLEIWEEMKTANGYCKTIDRELIKIPEYTNYDNAHMEEICKEVSTTTFLTYRNAFHGYMDYIIKYNKAPSSAKELIMFTRYDDELCRLAQNKPLTLQEQLDIQNKEVNKLACEVSKVFKPLLNKIFEFSSKWI